MPLPSSSHACLVDSFTQARTIATHGAFLARGAESWTAALAGHRAHRYAFAGRGRGPAALLLHGLRRPAYPLDRASYRILVRHGWLDPSADYDEARDVVERLDPDVPEHLARLSAWLERIGREYCRPTIAKCERCPLRSFLPEGGPRESGV